MGNAPAQWPMLTPRLERLVAIVERNEAEIGALSTGERLAVALVLDRADLVRSDGYTILEAIARLGADWTRAAYHAQRERVVRR